MVLVGGDILLHREFHESALILKDRSSGQNFMSCGRPKMAGHLRATEGNLRFCGVPSMCLLQRLLAGPCEVASLSPLYRLSLLRVTRLVNGYDQHVNLLMLGSRARAPSPGLCCLSAGPLSLHWFLTSTKLSTWHEHMVMVLEGGGNLSGRGLMSWVCNGWESDSGTWGAGGR